MDQLRARVYGRQSRGKEKSIKEQIELCTADAEAQGWNVTGTYRDATSASRYRTREREDWPRVVAAVRAHEFDVLVLWISSRGDRDLTSWSSLLDAARLAGVLIRVTDDDRTYDVRKSPDWQALAQQGIGNAVDSDKISTSVKRGQAGAAKAGRPAQGKPPVGYRRSYDPHTGELAGQEPDPETAPTVREIIERVAASEPLVSITADLRARNAPGAGAAGWYRQQVRQIALNPAYIGLRVHKGVAYPAAWPAIVDPATFYAAARVLGDPGRVTTRPGRQRHLCSYLAVCDHCGGPMTAVKDRYRCWYPGCAQIERAPVDELVTAAMLARLADPAIYGELRQAGDEADRQIVEAWAEVSKLTAQLDEWRRSAARGQTTPESLAAIEPDLTRRIRAAERRAEQAAAPPALRDVLEPGADLAARWEALTLPARRQVVRVLVDELRISRADRRGAGTFDPARLDNSRWRGDQLTWGERRRSTMDA